MHTLHEQRTLGSSAALNQKMAENIMYLEFNFRRDLFYAKVPKLKYCLDYAMLGVP